MAIRWIRSNSSSNRKGILQMKPTPVKLDVQDLLLDASAFLMDQVREDGSFV